MKPYFGMPTWPGHYAWKVLWEAGITSPPVPLEPLADHLNLKVRYFCASHHFTPTYEDEEDELYPPAPPTDAPLFDDGPYWRSTAVSEMRQRRRVSGIDGVLRRKSRTVWLDSEKPHTRQRVTFGHECGHDVMPGHQTLGYLEHGCLINPGRINAFEQEATNFGVHLLMPTPWFFEDVHSVGFGLGAVDELCQRYLTSLEATAIRYVHLNLHPCALVMAERNPKFPDNWDFPLLVRYSVRNSRFQDHIRPGTPLPSGSRLVSVSISQTPCTDRATGWDLGLRIDRRYQIECRPWGRDGDVMALVWQISEGKQGELFPISCHLFAFGERQASGCASLGGIQERQVNPVRRSVPKREGPVGQRRGQ